MAAVGTLGEVVFSASSRAVRTFSGLKHDSSANYTQHARHLKTPLAEFTGNGAETISFSMLLSVHLGIKPKREAEKLREYLNEGKTLYFILGTERIGNYKWVITKLSQSDFRIDNKGNVIAVKVNVTLNSYEKR